MYLTFFPNKPSSNEMSNERLKLILMNDRSCVSPELIEIVKSEIIDVISKYFDINKSLVEIKVINNKIENVNSFMMVANIPIKRYLNKKTIN